jgi:hypothetical protein
MSFGLALQNKDGQLMFSTDYTAFHFIGKFTATDTGSFRCAATFTCLGTPLVFIDGNNGNNSVAILEITNNGGNSWTAYVGGRTLANAGLTSIDIYVFGFPSTPSSSGYGGFTKNASGDTTLNLQQRVLKITGGHQTVLRTSSSTSLPPNESLTFGSIPSDYIVCSTGIGEIISPAGPNGLLLGMAAYRSASTTVGFFATLIYAVTPPGISSYRIFESQYILFADKTLYQ